MLISLTLLAGIGLLYCIAIHSFMYLSTWHPSGIMPITLNVGMGVLFFYIAYISKKWRKRTGRHMLKCLVDILPKWAKVMIVSISVLGLSIFLFYLIASFSYALDENSTVQLTLNKFYRSFSALLMVFYVIEFAILYSYRVLLKSETTEAQGDLDYMWLK